MLTFEETKKELLRRGWTFEDRDFPADKSSLGEIQNVTDVVWRRPKELRKDPKFIVNGVSRLDIVQGEIADCWFISAAACLAFQRPKDFEWCVPMHQSFEQDYAGIFLFRFWEFGSWTEIYIDDRLPTSRDGELLFAHNKREPDEFWVPLFEKAYAKLKGRYSYLDGGQTTYALVDFTGGITEKVDLRAERLMSGKLFQTMMDISQKRSMMGCEIVAKDGVIETKLSNGLYSGHAYSISSIMLVPTILGTKVKLLRLRNPWGAEEWTGDWSDGSRQWGSISDGVKKELELENMEDGEFWMSYDDWIYRFEFLTICHLEPENITTEVGQKKEGKSRWEVMKYHNEWIAGFNAGGASGASFGRDSFFTNPQFKITIPSPPAISPSSHPSTTVIISLMQFSRFWDEQKVIGFDLYKVRDGVRNIETGSNYGRGELSFAKTGCAPTVLREATSRLVLYPGNYVVIPYTMRKNDSCKFLLRIYTEVAVVDDKVFNTPTAIIPAKNPHFIEREKVQTSVKDLFKKFVPVTSQHMDARELLAALDSNAKQEGWPGFTSLEAARSLVSVFGVSKQGFVTQEELHKILKDLQYWTEQFKAYDADKSGTISYTELTSIYAAIGIQASHRLVEAIVGKYAGRSGEVALDEFSLCSCKIKHTYDVFKKLSEEGKLRIDLEEWMAVALTL